LELKTETPLDTDFMLHAMPDACVNLLFNQKNSAIAGVTALRTRYTELNLGTSFHYVGIELLPGVWQGNPTEIRNQFVGTPYTGELPLVATGRRMVGLDFSSMPASFVGTGAVVYCCQAAGEQPGDRKDPVPARCHPQRGRYG